MMMGLASDFFSCHNNNAAVMGFFVGVYGYVGRVRWEISNTYE